MASPRVFIKSVNAICSLGSGLDAVADNLFNWAPEANHFSFDENYSTDRKLPLGIVSCDLLATGDSREETRNNRLLRTTVDPLLPEIEALKAQFDASRIAVVMGTSTSGIAEGEMAMAYRSEHGSFPDGYHYRKQEIYSPARYLANLTGVTGPAFAVSSACTSGAKALISAARLLRLNVVDAVIAGGVDTLCHMTIEGFSSLSVTTSARCNPFSVNRQGINIGEGAGVAILTRDPADIELLGYGESSDAHHISSPHPDGFGAELAMQQALQSAGLTADEVDYINLHGTATQQNDLMEAKAVNRVLGGNIPCGSTKSLTGHTLAAAGALEAIFCYLTLLRNDGKLPAHWWDGAVDPEMPALTQLALEQAADPVKVAMSNSFAFGGNNASLVLARSIR